MEEVTEEAETDKAGEELEVDRVDELPMNPKPYPSLPPSKPLFGRRRGMLPPSKR
jgi:hypothetical protein